MPCWKTKWPNAPGKNTVTSLYKIAHSFTILQQWDNERTEFLKNIAIIRKRPGTKPVHELRVCIKKMRSCLKLNEAITGTSWRKSFIPVKILFSVLGRQRNIEMSAGLISAYIHQQKDSPLQAFSTFLAAELKIARHYSQLAAIDFDENLLNALTSILRKSGIHHNTQLYSKLEAINKKNLNSARKMAGEQGKNFHVIRKMIKEILYTQPLCPEDKTEPAKLDKLQHILGLWQDCFIILEKLDYFKKELAVKGSNLSLAVQEAKKWIKKNQQKYLQQATMLLAKIR